jgi:ADP-ribosylglycohydrolase
MLGAIIGDIAGSTHEVEEVNSLKRNEINYERRLKILDKSVPLFNEESSYTDDSVLTAAIANALLTDKNYYKNLKEFGLREINLGLDKYGRSRFGRGFTEWLKGDSSGRSYGNGCAMRISPIANYFNNLDKVINETREATFTSHRNCDSDEMSKLVSICIYLSKIKKSKEYIKLFLKNIYGYRFNYNLEYLQKNYKFTSAAIDSVPQAVFCFFESNSFEDAIRKAISIGGDSDTIAAITGSIAEAYYGIDDKLIKQVEKYLPEYIINIVNDFYMKTKGYEPFKNELKQFFKNENLYSEEFFDFIKQKVKVVSNELPKEWFGCFPMIDNYMLKDIRLLVPEIKNQTDLLINIKTYAKALELYKHLGTEYKCINKILDAKADDLEKKYLKNKSI